MEHSIDLTACHFIQDVTPSSTQKIIKKIKDTLWDADTEDSVDLDALDVHLASGNFNENSDSDSEAKHGDQEKFENFDIADAVGKALALVKQVSCHLYKLYPNIQLEWYCI